jgi:probable HAF family extracellular repeat protein
MRTLPATAPWRWTALLLTATACEGGTEPAPPSYAYTVTVLGPMGAATTQAAGMNGRGHVVGSAAPAGQPRQAFLWKDGQFTALAGRTPDAGSEARDVNDDGVVVGASGGRAVVWQGTAPADLHPAGATLASVASAINARGDVAGYTVASPTSTERGILFVRRGGQTVRLPAPWGSAEATSINDAGVVAGRVGQAGWFFRPFVVRDTSFEYLYPLPNPINTRESSALATSFASDINAAGQLVGGTGERAFVWQGGSFRDLASPPGNNAAVPTSINAGGQVVGFYWTTAPGRDPHALVWIASGPVDLNTQVAPSDWIIGSAVAINDRGQIAANGTHRVTGAASALLLTPTP